MKLVLFLFYLTLRLEEPLINHLVLSPCLCCTRKGMGSRDRLCKSLVSTLTRTLCEHVADMQVAGRGKWELSVVLAECSCQV